MTSQQQMNQPVIFLSEGSKRVQGRDALSINIMIGKAVAEAVKTTLGPKGRDKMIVDELGDVTITNDGATILSQMSIDHPIGKMMVEIAKTQDDQVGDGTTTVVVLAGGLLQKAEQLLSEGIHPTTIIKGYRDAAKKAKELFTEVADKISPTDKALVKEIAKTSMTGKSSEMSEELSDLVLKAITEVTEKKDNVWVVDRDSIKVEKKAGGSLDDSRLVQGIVLDKERVHTGMPKEVKDAKIALLDVALEIKSPETDTKVQISSPDQLQEFLDQEEKMLKNMVDTVKKAGATVLICQKGIDDIAQHFLAKEGIFAVRRVKKSDLDKLAKATGGTIVSRINDLTKKDLGFAASVHEEKIGGEEMTFIEKCKNPKAVTILLRGGSEHVIDEAERSINDAIGSTTASLEDGLIVSGGGSCEIEVALKLRNYAQSVGGREQLAIEAFADVLEIIPKTLAESAGMDPIDALVDLRAKHKGKEGKYVGVDVYAGKTANMKEKKVMEPLRIKLQAVTSAAEVTEMILRIDDIIAGVGKSAGPGMGGMPGGMPGEGMGE